MVSIIETKLINTPILESLKKGKEISKKGECRI
jgi:hypothetical protein